MTKSVLFRIWKECFLSLGESHEPNLRSPSLWELRQPPNTENIEIHLQKQVRCIVGEDKVTSIEIGTPNDYSNGKVISVDGVFPYIGMSPNLPNLKYKKWNIGNLDEHFDTQGYLTTDLGKENCETKWPGVYAIGDIHSKQYRQVITAMSDGAVAAIHISKNI